ncbi:RseA family anti-sigma factor [Pseudomonas aeruginosa]|uniref:RseA family anti-sigma factor n=1 Tax=Pseudomonas aeruginosa TaxID=287 RepID=UPI003D28B0BC
MSREALQETLSAVMDNEADELELRRVLAACGEDAELRSTWSRYQLARSVMHREPTLPKLDSEEQGAPQVITNSSSSDTRWHEQRLPIYLRQHVQQSAVSGTESALPYARAASLENR